MKSFDHLNNVDRAKLLHELFPDEIPGLLEFTRELCGVIQQDRERVAKSWNNPFLTAGMWFGFAESTARKIDHYKKKLHHSGRLFADQLFDGYAALFMSHCLFQYERSDKWNDPKFISAVKLFFAYNPKA